MNRSPETCCASATTGKQDYEVDEKGRRKFTLPMPDFEEPHPYGSGVSHELNWEGYNFAEADAKHKREAKEFANMPMVPDENRWAIVTTPDVIQWRSNLFRLSRDPNYSSGYHMTEVGVACVPEFGIYEIYGRAELNDVELYTVALSSRSDWLTIEPEQDRTMKVMLCFEGKADAQRLADYLVAEGTSTARCVMSKVGEIRSEAKRSDVIIGLIPETTIISTSVLDSDTARSAQQ